MRYSRIFFISYLLPELKNNAYPDPGMGYIIENAKKLGIEYDFLDNRLSYKFSYLLKRIKDFKPDLIAVGMKTGRYLKQYDMLEEFKKNLPDTDIICGGDHISVFREKALSECASIDYGIPFEGEIVFNNLIKGNDEENIKGLIHRTNDEIIFNGFQDLIENLDDLEFPKYEKVDFSKYSMKEIGITRSKHGLSAAPPKEVMPALEKLYQITWEVE